ncbi:uracil-DNA glycosylase-like protein [Aspergillus unguis]
MAKSPVSAGIGTRSDAETVFGDDDVPVNQITSFNGVLNKYVHVSERTTTSSSSTFMSSQETKRQLDNETSEESQTTPKRRRPISRTISTPEAYLESATPRRTTRSQSRSLTPASRLTSPFRSGSKSPTLLSTPDRSQRGQRSSSVRRQTSSPSALQSSLLRDTIPHNLTLLLVGVNPGIMTGTTGYAYAHPSNLFWKLLHSSGITSIRHPPSDTYRLPELYNVGNTNIVERPTRDASMLSKAEMDAGVPVLEAKIANKKPAAVCLVGKSIWEAVWRARKGKAIKKEEFRYGWQGEEENMGKGDGWKGSPVFVATTTSGLAAGMSMAEKQAVWNELGKWVVERRARDHVVPSSAPTSVDNSTPSQANY